MKLLESIKNKQQSDIQSLERLVKSLDSKSHEIEAKLGHLTTNLNNLTNRATKVARFVHAYKSSPLSSVERQFNDEMNERNARLKIMNDRIQEVN